MNITLLAGIRGTMPNENMKQTLRGLKASPSGLDNAACLACYLGQLAEESGGWVYDHELWGPTRAQLGYEGRKDLGNLHPGDGYKFRGRGPIQITGRFNYTLFTEWVHAQFPSAPDFTVTPEALLLDPWEGLSAIWYWSTHHLNALALLNNIEGITKAINGGTTHLVERVNNTMRASMLLLGFVTIKSFQAAHGLVADGIPGPLTRAGLHAALLKLPLVTFEV